MSEKGTTRTGIDGLSVTWEADPDKMEIEVSIMRKGGTSITLTGREARRLAKSIATAVRDAEEEHHFLTYR